MTDATAVARRHAPAYFNNSFQTSKFYENSTVLRAPRSARLSTAYTAQLYCTNTRLLLARQHLKQHLPWSASIIASFLEAYQTCGYQPAFCLHLPLPPSTRARLKRPPHRLEKCLSVAFCKPARLNPTRLRSRPRPRRPRLPPATLASLTRDAAPSIARGCKASSQKC